MEHRGRVDQPCKLTVYSLTNWQAFGPVFCCHSSKGYGASVGVVSISRVPDQDKRHRITCIGAAQIGAEFAGTELSSSKRAPQKILAVNARNLRQRPVPHHIERGRDSRVGRLLSCCD
jgi:hypothetical protein